MRLAADKDQRVLVPAPALSPAIGARMPRHAAWRLGQTALVIAGCLVCAALLFVHLDRSPRTWFDEGSHLHVPKTLVQTGHYADRSSEGFRAFGPTVGVGPTVMLPIAAVFKIGGIGLLGARLVIALYTIIAIARVRATDEPPGRGAHRPVGGDPDARRAGAGLHHHRAASDRRGPRPRLSPDRGARLVHAR